MVEWCIGYPFLQGMGVEVGIPYLDSDAWCELLLFSQLECNLFDHAYQQLIEPHHVCRIFFESMFRAYRFLFRIAEDGSRVNSIGLFPYFNSIFAHQLFQHLCRNIPEGVNCCNTHRPEHMIGLIADHGYFSDRQRIEEWMHNLFLHLYLTVWLCLSGCNLGYCLVDGEAYWYWQPGLFNYMLPQFMRPFVASIETIHPG